MRIWIICSGESSAPVPRRCGAGEYAALCEKRLCLTAPAGQGHVVEANGRKLYISPRGAAHGTAALLVSGARAVCEPLLDEIPPALPRKEKSRALWLWDFQSRLRWSHGGKRVPESRKESRARADALLDRLEREGEDCILISHPRFISVLCDRLRVRGYCAQRTGFGRVRPFEQMLLSRRDEHCGGCQHNCLLSNPGCNIGRDKAARAGVS